jgi:hypothetical protein
MYLSWNFVLPSDSSSGYIFSHSSTILVGFSSENAKGVEMVSKKIIVSVVLFN